MKIKSLIITFLILGLSVGTLFAFGPNSVLCWDKGPEADIAKYKVYFGTSAGVHGPPVDVGIPTAIPKCAPQIGVRLGDLGTLPQGTIFLVVTAEDTSQNESGKSNEIFGPFDSVAPGVLKNPSLK